MDNSKKRPVVMQILPALESGGVERGTIDVARALKNEGFDAIVISSGGILVYQLKEMGIKHILLPVKSKNPITIFLNIRKISEIIKEYGVDVVHVRSRAPMWSAYFACRVTKAKLVTTVHGFYSLNFLRWKIFKPKKRYNEIMLKADAVIAVSNFIKEKLIEDYQSDFSEDLSKKITVIHRGADFNHFRPEMVARNRIIDLSKKWSLPEDKKIILMPGRFTSWKGHEFLINSLKKVKNDFFCIFVGSDHGHKRFLKKIEQKIIQEKLADKIRIVGVCKDMPACYAISHLVVAPSVKPEAFGRIAIESCATSRIVIATNIGGYLETIIDKKTGFLVTPNDEDGLAKTIDDVLSLSDHDYSVIAKQGREHIENLFSNKKMCDKTLEIYHTLLEKTSPSLE